MSSIKKTLAFSLGTLFSRITGLVRDVILAKTFGASSTLDAYYISIVFPFFLRRTFAEGAMSSAFLAIYKSWRTRKRKHNSLRPYSPLSDSSLSLLFLFPKFFLISWHLSSPQVPMKK